MSMPGIWLNVIQALTALTPYTYARTETKRRATSAFSPKNRPYRLRFPESANFRFLHFPPTFLHIQSTFLQIRKCL